MAQGGPTTSSLPRRVLITGIAGTLAGRLALRLEADERVEYVGGVDLTQPSHELKRTEFVRADLRNPLVAKVIESTRVDTIVHMSISAEPGAVGGRSRMKELNVIGTMQMLGAAQKSPRVRNVVLRSTTAVYGSHYRDPALFREDTQPRTVPRSGYTKDITEVEGYARGFGRRRPDVDLSILRFANFIGPEIDTTITRYLSMPVIPTVLGYDPRLQLLHTDDALEVLYRATMGGHPGIFNVAAPGIVYLSQAARMAGRPTVPVPAPLGGVLSALLRPLSGVDFTAEQLPLLQFGRVGDISRMRREFDYEPVYSTKAALQQFIDSGRITPMVDRARIEDLERRVGDAIVSTLGEGTLTDYPSSGASQSAGAEVIRLDSRRRGMSAAESELRERCREPRADGAPCRLYLDEAGLCRVCQPERAQPAAPTGPTAAMPELPVFDDAAVEDLERAVRGMLAFVRRRLTGDYEVDDYGFDRDLTEQVIMPLARPLYQQWWRVRTVGIHNVPLDGGALLVANHAGTVPFDAVMTKLAVLDEHAGHRHVRELAADLALKVPLIGPLARKTGNTLAHSEDAINLLGAGELVGVWPEGFKGIGKPYRDRYKLQRFGRGGFVEVAIRAGVPIIPVATIGSEEIYPIIANLKPLARLLGFPYFPITWQFPLLGPLGLVPLPSKWVIEFGEPIHTEQYGPDAADDPMKVFEITDRVRDTIQTMIYRNLVGRRSIFF